MLTINPVFSDWFEFGGLRLRYTNVDGSTPTVGAADRYCPVGHVVVVAGVMFFDPMLAAGFPEHNVEWFDRDGNGHPGWSLLA